MMLPVTKLVFDPSLAHVAAQELFKSACPGSSAALRRPAASGGGAVWLWTVWSCPGATQTWFLNTVAMQASSVSITGYPKSSGEYNSTYVNSIGKKTQLLGLHNTRQAAAVKRSFPLFCAGLSNYATAACDRCVYRAGLDVEKINMTSTLRGTPIVLKNNAGLISN